MTPSISRPHLQHVGYVEGHQLEERHGQGQGGDLDQQHDPHRTVVNGEAEARLETGEEGLLATLYRELEGPHEAIEDYGECQESSEHKVGPLDPGERDHKACHQRCEDTAAPQGDGVERHCVHDAFPWHQTRDDGLGRGLLHGHDGAGDGGAGYHVPDGYQVNKDEQGHEEKEGDVDLGGKSEKEPAVDPVRENASHRGNCHSPKSASHMDRGQRYSGAGQLQDQPAAGQHLPQLGEAGA